MTIKKTVHKLVKLCNTNDPFVIAKELGITIVFEPLGSIYGYYSKTKRCKVIHINDTLPHERQLTTCGHELGHAVLHPNDNAAFLKANTFYSTNKYEIEANTFMLELLFNQGCEVITIREATEHYGVPEQLVNKNFYP